jgi:hypothetical protein
MFYVNASGNAAVPNAFAAGTAGGNGFVELQAGNTGQAGYIAWFSPSGTRIGYMGWDPTNILIDMDAATQVGFSTGGTQVFSVGNNGGATTTGSNSGYYANYRSTSGQLCIYGDGGGAHFWISNGGNRIDLKDNGDIYLNGNTLLPNNIYIYGFNTSGTVYPMLGMSNDNNVHINPAPYGNTYIGTASAGYVTGHFSPTTDNAWYCGVGPWGTSWYEVDAYHFGTMSDRNKKTDLNALPDCLDLVTAITPQRFRWRDGPSQRVHWGFIAQDVGEVMAREGHIFGGYIEHHAGDTVAGRVIDDDSYGLNYNELVALLWKATQELAARVAHLEGTA